jgi:hypothetical protein
MQYGGLRYSSVLWIRNHCSRIRIHRLCYSDSYTDSYTTGNILTWNFSKWCLSLLSCVLEPVRQRTKFTSRKNLPVLISLSSVWSAIFHKKFCFTTVSGSESKFKLLSDRIRPKLTDSFGFGSTTLVFIIVFDFIKDVFNLQESGILFGCGGEPFLTEMNQPYKAISAFSIHQFITNLEYHMLR